MNSESNSTREPGTPLAARKHGRLRRMALRIPLRSALAALKVVALGSHRAYMAGLLPVLRAAGMRIDGTPRYIAPTVFFDDFDQIALGDRVVISSHVSILTHDYSLTTERIAAGTHTGPDVAIVRPIRIGRNVFVGRGALLMPGTTIGDDVIIGAASVVRGNVPSDSVMLGNPASRVGSVSDLHRSEKVAAGGYDLRVD